jgi:hypothetical protein
MVIQQNAISTEIRSAKEASYVRLHFHRTLLVVLLIAGITLLLSLQVYQAAVKYDIQTSIEEEQQIYAREQRLLAIKLISYAESQSIHEMARRAEAAGYGPPKPSQIRYVWEETGDTVSLADAARLTTAQR